MIYINNILIDAFSNSGSLCSAFLIIGSKWSQSSGKSWKLKSSPNNLGSIDLPRGSKQPINKPPESSLMYKWESWSERVGKFWLISFNPCVNK